MVRRDPFLHPIPSFSYSTQRVHLEFLNTFIPPFHNDIMQDLVSVLVQLPSPGWLWTSHWLCLSLLYWSLLALLGNLTQESGSRSKRSVGEHALFTLENVPSCVT